MYEQLTKQKLPNVKKGTTEPDMTTAAEPEILTMGVVFYQNNSDETVLEGYIPNIDLSIDYTGNVVGVSGEWYNITSRNEVDTISTDSVIERIKSTDNRTYITEYILEDDVLQLMTWKLLCITAIRPLKMAMLYYLISS